VPPEDPSANTTTEEVYIRSEVGEVKEGRNSPHWQNLSASSLATRAHDVVQEANKANCNSINFSGLGKILK
jgi:hypothetical protein